MAPATFTALWAFWLLAWVATAGGMKPRTRGDSRLAWVARQLPYGAGLALLAWHAPRGPWSARLIPTGDEIAPSLFALNVCGLGFTLWARNVLGRNWSNVVVLREGHELVTDGPYALVRHPIYAGLLLAAGAWTLADGSAMALAGLILVAGSLAVQIRDEERLMRAAFGPVYDRYRETVPALLPKDALARAWAAWSR